MNPNLGGNAWGPRQTPQDGYPPLGQPASQGLGPSIDVMNLGYRWGSPLGMAPVLGTAPGYGTPNGLTPPRSFPTSPQLGPPLQSNLAPQIPDTSIREAAAMNPYLGAQPGFGQVPRRVPEDQGLDTSNGEHTATVPEQESVWPIM